MQAEADLYILAWTTTPWTLPSNTALTVGKKINYVVVETYNQYTHLPIRVLLAQALVGKQFSGKYVAVESKEELLAYSANDKKIPYLITNEILGEDLVGILYEQLCQSFAVNAQGHVTSVISGDFDDYYMQNWALYRSYFWRR